MAAWFGVYEEYDFDFDVISKIPHIELSAKMIYQAAKQGNFYHGKPFKYTFIEFATMVGNMRNSDGDRLREVFVSSAESVAERMNDLGGEKSKKK